MSTAAFEAFRAKYGGLVRDRAPDDPELLDTKHAMQAEALVVAVEKALRKAPPMSDELRNASSGCCHDRSGRITPLVAATGLKSSYRKQQSPFWCHHVLSLRQLVDRIDLLSLQCWS